MIGTDLSKHQKLDSNPKTMQQINFTENLSGNSNRLMFFIIEEAKERNQIFHKELLKLLKH